MAESVRRRYFFKLFGTAASGALTFLYQGILTRLLGSERYGQYTFVQTHLEAVFGALDLGASTTFFTQISQDRRNYLSSTSLLGIIIGSVTGFVLLYLLTVVGFGLSDTVWPGVGAAAMLAGFPLGVAVFVSRVAVKVTDAAGVAQRVEIWRTWRALLAVAIVAVLYYLQRPSLALVLVGTAFSYLFFTVSCFTYGHREMGGGKLDFSSATLRTAFARFRSFGQPLFFYGLLTMPLGLFERWLLQFTSGSVQQGYIGIATQLSLVIYLLTSALTPIFHRESAVSFAAQDLARLRRLFDVYIRRFFAIAAFLSVFLAFHAENILLVVSGSGFQAGWPVVALMALYPIQQTVGNLSIAIQFSTNRTREYLILGLIRDVFGLLLVYFLMAPSTWAVPGLQMGAMGLAWKWIGSQFLNTTMSEYLNCRFLGLSYRKQAWNELRIFVGLALVGWGSAAQPLPGLSPVFRLVLCGILYTLGGAAVVWVFPQWFGWQRTELKALAMGALQRSVRRK